MSALPQGRRPARRLPRMAEVLLVVFIAGTILLQFFAGDLNAEYLLGFTIFGMLGALASLGVTMTGHPLGVIIDNRNRISLSKAQMLAWTVVVVSGMSTAASEMLVRHARNPLELGVPWELFAAMGISAATLVGAPAVLSVKLDEQPSQDTVDKAIGKDPDLSHSGKVAIRRSGASARLSDLFTGDEISNATSPDLTKIQSFAITALLIGVYLSAMAASFAAYFNPQSGLQSLVDAGQMQSLVKSVAAAAGAPGAQKVASEAVAAAQARSIFPPLSSEFLWLMAISHGAYLAYKAAPHGGDGEPRRAGDETARIHALG